MPRTRKKARKARELPMQHYIFEIKGWEPSYLFSVAHGRYETECYSEYADIELEGLCVFPETLAGRVTKIMLSGRRDCLEPRILQHDPDWKPRCIGGLEMSATDGRFDATVPYDALPFLMQAIALREFRYLLAWGPALYRRKSLCTTMHFEKEVDLKDY
jgi:hypothetical protein